MGFPGPGLGGIIARSSVPGPFALARGQRGPKREHGATVFSKPGPSRGCPRNCMQPVFAPFATGLPGRRREAEVPPPGGTPGCEPGDLPPKPVASANIGRGVPMPWSVPGGQRCGRRDADSSSVFERRPDPGAPARTTSVALSQPAAYRPGAGRRHLPHQARRRPPGRRPGTRRGGRGAGLRQRRDRDDQPFQPAIARRPSRRGRAACPPPAGRRPRSPAWVPGRRRRRAQPDAQPGRRARSAPVAGRAPAGRSAVAAAPGGQPLPRAVGQVRHPAGRRRRPGDARTSP